MFGEDSSYVSMSEFMLNTNALGKIKCESNIGSNVRKIGCGSRSDQLSISKLTNTPEQHCVQTNQEHCMLHIIFHG